MGSPFEVGSRVKKNVTTRFSYIRFSSSGKFTKFPCAIMAISRGSPAFKNISRVILESSGSSAAPINMIGTPDPDRLFSFAESGGSFL